MPPGYVSITSLVILPLLGTNLSEWLNIQKRETPSCGPSFTNSWPRPFPHLPHRTCMRKTQSHQFLTDASAVVKQRGLRKPTDGRYEMLSCTLKAVRVSIILVTLSSRMVSVKAGQGDEWGNLDRLENSGWLHWEHTYIPAGDSHC